jgi:N-acetylglucosaminyldiphosphoundecaprenol N-acetyl-beta-D-mannosaminyltransferase
MKDDHCEIIAGYKITTQGIDSGVEQVVRWIKVGDRGRYLVCANPHSLELARKDTLFREAICNADLVTPDGIGIVLASKIHNGTIRGRVTGSDIFLGLSRALNQEKGYRYFFLGSTEETLNLIKERMKVEFPNIEVAGTYSPPFKTEFSEADSKAMIESVNRAQPHVLWVGMTAPKQEKWVFQHRDQLQVRFIGPIGAAFDFFAGTKKRSGEWFRDRGYEWLPRLFREPRRLWHRNFVTFPIFVFRNIVTRIYNKNH